MNRDWFARTQVETDTKLELLRRYPGMLYVDAHEMGANHYFFPPTADPTYHEITSQSMEWQDFLYGDALAAEFKRQHISVLHEQGVRLLRHGLRRHRPGDRVQRGRDDLREGELRSHRPADVRALRHALGLALPGRAQPRGHPPRLALRLGRGVPAGTRRRARAERGERRGNTVQLPVPNEKVRHYFLRADDPAKAAEVQMLVRRLQRMDVEVYRLTAPLTVPDFKPYGRPAGGDRPAGGHLLDPDGADAEALDPVAC